MNQDCNFANTLAKNTLNTLNCWTIRGFAAVLLSIACSANVLASSTTNAKVEPDRNLLKSAQGQKSDNSAQVEREIDRLLSPQVGISFDRVSCPNNIELKAGKIYNCEVKIPDGTFVVEVRMTDSKGGFTVKSKGLIILSKVQSAIDSTVKEKTGVQVETACSGLVRFVKAGDIFSCQVKTSEGSIKSAKVTVKNEYGDVDFEVLGLPDTQNQKPEAVV